MGQLYEKDRTLHASKGRGIEPIIRGNERAATLQEERPAKINHLISYGGTRGGAEGNKEKSKSQGRTFGIQVVFSTYTVH